MAKASVPNQGPDSSLVYQPDVDQDSIKDKGSFRNYTVRPDHP